MRKILISGSCVSRDSLNFIDNSEYSLVGYHARSSLATLSSPELTDFLPLLDSISSPFQRKMVSNDLLRKLLINSLSMDFDIMLFDLIDERFHLAVLGDNVIATRSNEFLNSSIEIRSLIDTHSSIYFDFWKRGVDKFFSCLSFEIIKKIKVQKAYWTNILDSGEKCLSYSDLSILKENKKLDKMYEYLSNYLTKSQFIEVPKELLVINSNHKWGISAFHYIDDYYHYLNKELFPKTTSP